MPSQQCPDSLSRESAPRILIVRLSAIGDVLMASPVAQLLREAYPGAHITWIVEALAAPVVRANPYVDDIIVVERKTTWRRLRREGRFLAVLREMGALVRDLRQRRFDIAIDCQGLLKSALIAWLSGAQCRIGARRSHEPTALFLNRRVATPARVTRLSEAYTAILAGAGIAHEARSPVLAVAEEERDAAASLLAARGLAGARYAACCIASSRAWKEWPLERWPELADRLWERHGLHTVFLAGPERREDAERLVASCASAAVSLVGETSLLQSCAIVQGADVVIGGDTGITYAGLATGVPTVALYGSTDPTWLTDEPGVAILYHRMPCSPCARRPVCRHYDCMQAITVDEVDGAVSALLAERQSCC